MMSFFCVFLIWFFGGGILTAFVQYEMLRRVPKSKRRAPCISVGFLYAPLRMALIVFLCTTLLDLPARNAAILAVIVADVLWTACQIWYTVRTYGSYARRTGFAIGSNFGSLLFGFLYFCSLFF